MSRPSSTHIMASTWTGRRKDSWQHRTAGAEEVMVVSDGRWALLHENLGREEGELDAVVARMKATVDLVLVEGFRQSPLRKLEVYRPSLGKPAFPCSGPGHCSGCDRRTGIGCKTVAFSP